MYWHYVPLGRENAKHTPVNKPCPKECADCENLYDTKPLGAFEDPLCSNTGIGDLVLRLLDCLLSQAEGLLEILTRAFQFGGWEKLLKRFKPSLVSTKLDPVLCAPTLILIKKRSTGRSFRIKTKPLDMH